MATLTSKLIVQLLDRVTGPTRAVTAALSRLNDAQARNNARLDAVRGRMLEAGAVAYGLARAVSAPVRAATEFETALEDIGQKINAPISELPKLGQEIREVARATTQSASEIAAGMDVLAGMGASRGDALALLNPIGRAATAYNASIADLSQAGYAALDNLKVPADQFTRALDSMAQAGKAGAFELRDMAQYFPSLGAGYAALNQVGVPAVADLSAALQIVRKGAGDSAEAATNLSNVLQKITAPQTRKAFAKIGVDLESELAKAAQAGLTPIEAIAEITNRALGGDLSKLGDLFQDAQAQKGLRPLIQNIDEYRKIRAEALAAQGVVEADYQRRLQTGAIATQRWRIAMESLNLAIGNALLPALTSLANDIIPIVNKMAEWADKHPALTRAIVATTAGLVALRLASIAAQFSFLWMKGGVITAAIGGLRGLTGAGRIASAAMVPVAAGLRTLRTAMIGYAATAAIAGQGTALTMMGRRLLGLLNPLRLVTGALRILKMAVIGTGIGAVLVGIAMAGTWIYNNWTGISTAFEAFKGAFMRAIEPIMPAIQPVLDGFQWLWEKVSNLLGPIDELGGGWATAGLAAGKFVGDTLVAIVELPSKITALAGELISAGMSLAQSLWDGVIAKIDEMIAWFTNLPSRIIAAIGSIDIGSLIKWPSPPAWLSRLWGGGGSGPSVPSPDGARAAGGPVRAGGTYLVGEKGPELVTFPQAGFVHDALKTARVIRNAALASAVAVPAISAPAIASPSTPPQPKQAPQIYMEGIKIEVNAAPGQSPQEIAMAVRDELSAHYHQISDGAFSDGVY